jgi:HK97 family phage portal protein
MSKKKSKAPVQPPQVFAEVPQYSVGDPAFAEFLIHSGLYGYELTENQTLGLTAVWRAQSIIAQTIAGLPLKVYEDSGDSREEVDHFLSSDPAGPYDMSAFNWTETVLLHVLNHGEAFLKAITNGGGETIGYWPIHPMAINKVEWDGADKLFTVGLTGGGTEQFRSGEIVHIVGMTMDGLRGLSPLSLFRQSFQTTRAGEVAANRTFTNGMLFGGLVSTEEEVDGEEAKAIHDSLNAKITGAANAGSIAFVNRMLKFSPWTMSNQDAEFLASRSFQVEEVSRIYGVPPHLLAQTEKQTSWGTGVSEQNAGLARYTLMSFTSRIESTLKKWMKPLVPEFSYKGLLAGTPKEEIELLLAQVSGGLLTADEARALMNLPPMPKEEKPEPEPAPAEDDPKAEVDPNAD